MKKQILFCAAYLILAVITISCSTANEDKAAIQPQTVNAVMKTEKMLSFESSLKVWFQSRNENGTTTLGKQSSDAIKSQSKALLTEIGVSQNDIEGKVSVSDDALVMFTLEQYSKKLQEMYNQKNK
jgi:hypothetical protein